MIVGRRVAVWGLGVLRMIERLRGLKPEENVRRLKRDLLLWSLRFVVGLGTGRL